MDQARQLYARLKAEAPFAIFVLVIYSVGAALFQVASFLSPALAFLPGPMLEIGGFALTFFIARWWYARFVGAAASPETVDQLTAEIQALREDIAFLREQRLTLDGKQSQRALDFVPAERYESARLRLSDEAASRNQAIARLSGELVRLLLAQGATSLLTRLATPAVVRRDRQP